MKEECTDMVGITQKVQLKALAEITTLKGAWRTFVRSVAQLGICSPELLGRVIDDFDKKIETFRVIVEGRELATVSLPEYYGSQIDRAEIFSVLVDRYSKEIEEPA